jgi:DNA-binding LytR/AlgR family response regulator
LKLTIEEKNTLSDPVPVEKISRIVVKKNAEYHCLNVNQIYYIEANGDYVLIYTDSNRYLKDQTMKYWETHLPDDGFVRIHRSFIVNIEVVARIELYEKETYKIHLKNGSILKASSSGYKLLKQKMRL